jgi:hypothetical protein
MSAEIPGDSDRTAARVALVDGCDAPRRTVQRADLALLPGHAPGVPWRVIPIYWVRPSDHGLFGAPPSLWGSWRDSGARSTPGRGGEQ